MSAKRRKKKSRNGKSRRISFATGIVLLVLAIAFSSVANWFVHHPRKWLERRCAEIPSFVAHALLTVGNSVGDLTDAFDWTGTDTVYEYDEEAPSGEVFFAGAPRHIGPPAPNDIVILDRGEFKIGWSPKLHHPVWCAYHVVRDARYPSGKRPNFNRDRAVPSAPVPSAYAHSGYDRGHMVPNYAIVTRYGEDEQKKTFLMSNIAPQSPSLNRGVWRDLEHRIADLWTARYGEIWVIVGCISPQITEQTLPGTAIDVPTKFYQLIVAQEGLNIRALAVLIEQDVPWGAYAARYIVTIDELEELTGLDFLPDLPSFIQTPLEAQLPSRLWPIRLQDVFQQLLIRYGKR